ncbi:MAG: glutathione S-transferase N-terminal domain-containing protein [Phenylobacterium sp.]|uniref:glutathione S-transferase N-terminal domain-containing protein n=1 Tax=Phenylobacterium sp. TaxID=1871053 RepID=UPI003BB75742
MTQAHQLYGRRGSHYTRLVRMFAFDAGLPYAFHEISDMRVLDPEAYGGHPALKLPVLLADGRPVFGAENICRWFAARAAKPGLVLWTEDVPDAELSNAQELVWLGMNAQVQIMMATRIFDLPPQHPYVEKLRQGLAGLLTWLDAQTPSILAALPRRDSSLFEYSLFCLVGHLLFRPSVNIGSWTFLSEFHADLAARACAQATPFTP